MSRLAYFTRETLISLRRNLLMTFAGVMTVVGVAVPVRRDPARVAHRRPRHQQVEARRGARDLHAGEGEPDPDRRGARRSSRPTSPTSRATASSTTRTRTRSSRSSSPTSPCSSRTTTPPALPDVVPGRADQAAAHHDDRQRVPERARASTQVNTPAEAGEDAAQRRPAGSGSRSSSWPACCWRRRCS